MNRLDEAVVEILATAPPVPELSELRGRVRHRRRVRRVAALMCVVAATAGALGVYSAIGNDAHERIAVSPQTTATPSTLNPRSAAANIVYVKRLVTDHGLPHSDAVTGVTAEGDQIVVSTNLADRTSAEELWEALSNAIGCDDSFLLIKGEAVVMSDGTRIDQGRPGFHHCAGT
jgi:hypothetical protein